MGALPATFGKASSSTRCWEEKIKKRSPSLPFPHPLPKIKTHLEPGLLLLLLCGRGGCRERAQVAVAALSGAIHCAPVFRSLSLRKKKSEKKKVDARSLARYVSEENDAVCLLPARCAPVFRCLRMERFKSELE